MPVDPAEGSQLLLVQGTHGRGERRQEVEEIQTAVLETLSGPSIKKEKKEKQRTQRSPGKHRKEIKDPETRPVIHVNLFVDVAE